MAVPGRRSSATRNYDPDCDTGYDARAAGTAMDAPGGTGAGADRDFVTSSYDPDRDTGYDARAVGTAMDAPADQDGRAAADHDAGRDTGYVDDSSTGAGRDYDPAQDNRIRGRDARRGGPDHRPSRRRLRHRAGRCGPSGPGG